MPEHIVPADTSTYAELRKTVKPGQKWGAVIGGVFVDGVGPPPEPSRVTLTPPPGRRAAARAEGRS